VLIPVLGRVRQVIAEPPGPNRLTRFTTVHETGASASVSVTLHAPKGYAAALAPGWTADGRNLKLDYAGLDDSPSFTIELTKS
jgi:hypothetical protein